MEIYKFLKQIFNLIGMAILLCQCNPADKDLETALSLAGDNRQELEKVLAHYSAPKDSLKYKAAVFLIENMPYHSGYYSDKFDRYDAAFDSMYSRCRYKIFSKKDLLNIDIKDQIFQGILDFFKEKEGIVTSGEFKVKPDINEISAQLLIENVDYAFKAWNFPWARNYSFEQFCKYILPHRYGQEPLESWRPFYMNQLSWVLDSVRDESSPIEVATIIDKWLTNNLFFSSYFESFHHGGIKCSNFLKAFVCTSCDDKAGLCTSCLRAMGIPAAIITFPKWGYANQGHSMVAVLNSDSKWNLFKAQVVDYLPKNIEDNFVPKIFIERYDICQPDIDPVVYQQLPYLLHAEDITADYINTTDIEIDIDPKIVRDHKYAFICVFDQPNWQPISWGRIKHGKIKFKSMGTGIVYLPVIYINNKMIPVSSPIKVYKNKHIQKIQLNKNIKTTYSFNRKYPIFYPDVVKSRCKDLVGGRFESADNKSFSNRKILYEINDIPPYYPELVKINNTNTRYVRYCFPQKKGSSLDGPGQIAFYTTQNGKIKKLKGKFFGSAGITYSNLLRLFDDDILTYVECFPFEANIELVPPVYINSSSGNRIWAGIEFDKEELITHVGYCPRNDKNGIYPGMNYELFYWDNKWNSLGIQTAGDSSITYNNIPEGALLWLRNLDEGKAERIYTIENNRIIWW